MARNSNYAADATKLAPVQAVPVQRLRRNSNYAADATKLAPVQAVPVQRLRHHV